ncbi:glycosyltransferase family 2 protein [Flavobacterium sp. Sr18]|uniref:glycosyltransferase family 2 protein n=1 Tax=Flavobacterium sp. Sr18 TaxID=935222 RepID=UPI0013E41C2A|nr:glycosyltransferase family 2 protein [Flavobacterium sp. Sr18]QIH39522.1 glycosyltransferase family 2 protein [Flavobacterium sp. Sr18]
MLAIIIPYYKFTFFEATLDSLAAQTNQNFKVYIGDDASPESPNDLLEKYQQKFDFVYHRFDENLGGTSLTQQWERCIALSNNEEWIMILGDDDVLGENVVDAFYANLLEIKKEGVNVVRFSTQSIDKVKNIISKVYINPKVEKATDFYYRRHSGDVRSSLSEHIFRRKSFLKYKFKNYPLAWHSDDYAWIEFAENKPVFAINDAIVTVVISCESLTGRTTNLLKKNIARSLFYMDLVKNNLNLFDENMRLPLLLQAEIAIKINRKLTLKEWNVLFFEYLKNYSTLPMLKFIRRFVKSLFQ